MVPCTEDGGISTSSPAAEVKRTANESPYTAAVARPRRFDVIASRLTKFLQTIFCLRRLRLDMVVVYLIRSASAPEQLPYLSRDCY